MKEKVPSSNTRPQVAFRQQTAVKHGHYKEDFKRSASPSSGSPSPEARQTEAPGGFHQQHWELPALAAPVTTKGEGAADGVSENKKAPLCQS